LVAKPKKKKVLLSKIVIFEKLGVFKENVDTKTKEWTTCNIWTCIGAFEIRSIAQSCSKVTISEY